MMKTIFSNSSNTWWMLVAGIFLFACNREPAELFIEAESFATKGGWVVDQQFMDLMGSPYLMAHGMGVPVGDASTFAGNLIGHSTSIFSY